MLETPLDLHHPRVPAPELDVVGPTTTLITFSTPRVKFMNTFEVASQMHLLRTPQSRGRVDFERTTREHPEGLRLLQILYAFETRFAYTRPHRDGGGHRCVSEEYLIDVC